MRQIVYVGAFVILPNRNQVIMKKVLCSIVTLLAAGAVANASDYDYLTFETTSGAVQSVAVESLVMTFEDGRLVARNGETEVSFAVADLSMMYFTSATTSINPLQAVSDEQGVVVYSVSGVCLGRYESVSQAKESLTVSGVYIMKSGSSTVKMVVR